MTERKIRNPLTRAAVAAAVAIGMLAAVPAAAQQGDFASYCFYDNNNVNVFVGDFEVGFYAHATGRPGNTRYYQRVGNTHRYVGETGAIYALFDNGDATWSDGRQTIRLYRC